VQAAIARAQAKRAGKSEDSADDKRKRLEGRLEKAQQRLADAKANDDANLAAYETAVSKLEKQLAELAPKAEEKPAEDDPVAAAIARAQAARAGKSEDSADDKRKRLEGRLEKAQQRLADAKANDDANLAAYETAVTKLEKQLAELVPVVEEPKEALDPVAAAIAKAQAQRAGNATATSPAEKRKKLEARLEKAKTKLQTAQEDNDPNLAAFENAVNKLQSQIDALEGEQ